MSIGIKLIRQRQLLRNSLLEEIYNLHFDPSRDRPISFPLQKINEDKDRKRAYSYLADSGYIYVTTKANFTTIELTASGIDYIEGLSLNS